MVMIQKDHNSSSKPDVHWSQEERLHEKKCEWRRHVVDSEYDREMQEMRSVERRRGRQQ